MPKPCGRVGTWDAAAAWAEESALGPVSFLAWRGSMPRSDAQKLIRTARLARSHERTGAALAAGEITVPMSKRSPPWRNVATISTPSTKRPWSEAAKSVEVLDFAAVTRRWATLADDVQARDDAKLRVRLAAASRSRPPWDGGSVVSGFLDPEASATVASVLSRAAASRRARRHPVARGAQRRRPHALGSASTRRSSSPESRPIAGVELAVSHEVLAGHPVANLDALRCDIEGFGPIARITAERLVCDCAIARS